MQELEGRTSDHMAGLTLVKGERERGQCTKSVRPQHSPEKSQPGQQIDPKQRSPCRQEWAPSGTPLCPHIGWEKSRQSGLDCGHSFPPHLLVTPSQLLRCFIFLFQISNLWATAYFFPYILDKFSASVRALNIIYMLMISKFISPALTSSLSSLLTHLTAYLYA